jgi:hypothetical protein
MVVGRFISSRALTSYSHLKEGKSQITQIQESRSKTTHQAAIPTFVINRDPTFSNRRILNSDFGINRANPLQAMDALYLGRESTP